MEQDPGLQRSLVPIPDPTLLTTLALKESIANLKELLETKIKAQGELFLTKSKCAEEAQTKAEGWITKQLESMSKEASLSRDAIDERVTALKERIDRGGGREEQRVEARTTAGWVVPMFVVGGICFVSVILQLIALMKP